MKQNKKLGDDGNTNLYIVGFGLQIYNLLIYTLYTDFEGIHRAIHVYRFYSAVPHMSCRTPLFPGGYKGQGASCRSPQPRHITGTPAYLNILLKVVMKSAVIEIERRYVQK